MTTYIGSVSNLSGGTLAISMREGELFWFIQNQDVAPLTITFPPESGMSSIILDAASALGSGGFIDSIGFPYFGPMTLSSSIASHRFGSGAREGTPINSYMRSV